MAKAPHPVEAHEAAVVASAAYFTAFQFRGAGNRAKYEGLTLGEARAAAHEMLDDFDRKPVMIYAVDAQGRQALAETVSR
jgi:nitrogen regulatory protein PII-like uncharacterized protein